MGIRDVQADFTYGGSQPFASIAGPVGTYIAPNAIDTSPYGSFLTEIAPLDTSLTAGSQGRDMGGDALKLIVNWTVQPTAVAAAPYYGSTNNYFCEVQLLTSANSDFSQTAAIVMWDSGALPIATLVRGFRQITPLPRSANWLQYIGLRVITAATDANTTPSLAAGGYMAWLAPDIESEVLGYVEGFPIK